MITRPLGKTGMTVSALGLGAGPLGDAAVDDAEAERLVRGAFDLGVNLVDTAPSYGSSEWRIGRVLSSMSRADREAVVIVTKGGYGVPETEDWTPEVIERGVDQALARLRTDRIDVFLLHSCPLERLRRGDLIAPLERVRSSGRVRAIGYSGDGDALRWAVGCAAFDVVECSVSIVDQEALAAALPESTSRGLGVLAKRAIAGAPWRDASSPYLARWQMAFAEPIQGIEPDELALRFTAFATGVTSALVGTRRLAHLERAAAFVERGPLDASNADDVGRRFATHGASWRGII